MIDGMSLSQIPQITKAKFQHYRRLEHIINQPSNKYLSLDKNLKKIIQSRRSFHVLVLRQRKIGNYLKNIVQVEQIQDKKKIQKLKKISMRRSQYRINSQPVDDNLLHHNSLYRIKKWNQSIERQNPQVAQRIITKIGDLSHEKDIKSFQKSRQILGRIQKFKYFQKIKMKISRKQYQLKTKNYQSFNERYRMSDYQNSPILSKRLK